METGMKTTIILALGLAGYGVFQSYTSTFQYRTNAEIALARDVVVKAMDDNDARCIGGRRRIRIVEPGETVSQSDPRLIHSTSPNPEICKAVEIARIRLNLVVFFLDLYGNGTTKEVGWEPGEPFYAFSSPGLSDRRKTRVHEALQRLNVSLEALEGNDE